MSRARRTAAAAGVAALAAAVAAACFSDRTGGLTGLPQDCQDLARAAGVAAGDVVVGIKDFAFVPARVEVPRGATVTWVNCESQPSTFHTATADDESWSSPNLFRGQTYSHTFTEPGEVGYYCIPHPNLMIAQVVVQ